MVVLLPGGVAQKSEWTREGGWGDKRGVRGVCARECDREVR